MTKTGTQRRKRKPGRPSVLTTDKRRRILAVLRVGGSLRDAAQEVGCKHDTITNTADREPEFLATLKKAEADGKLRHLRKIRKADAWQASAWFLERKYPEEYGRKERTQVELSGPAGAPIPVHVEPSTDELASLSRKDIKELAERALKGEDVGPELRRRLGKA